ncbi:peptide ABC transporter substrate-binding protein [Patescibacteria group bacterium]|nr:peptide ABC transporter substrate-binding protein [Patescibacteria group bacterium]
MMDKIPSLREFVYIIRNFSLKEKIAFFAFAVIFLTTSLLACWKISNFFLVETPAEGGTLAEGIIGTPRFINPVLAISDADRDMTNLTYSGLMRPDNKGGLTPDLAEKYEISDDGLIYTFTLKEHLLWQDGEPITSDDIVFTIQETKDPAIKSPRRAGWEGVAIEKIDERTVRFTLKKAYTPFLENTIIGILPRHIWQEARAEQMSFSEFNINPVGSGPYKIKTANKNSSGIVTSYELVPNKNFALGKSYLAKLITRFYPSEKELLSAYQKGDIDSVSAITPESAEKIKKSGSTIKNLFLPRVFGVFFNQNNSKIFTYSEVRYALDFATDKKRIIDEVLQGFGAKIDYPIPPGVFGALPSKNESYSIEKARQLLKAGGWKFNEEEKVWEKKENSSSKSKNAETLRLEFSLSTSDAPDLKKTAELVKAMWEEMGAKVNIKIYEIGDLNQNIIRPRKYDALLFGEIIGRDPDPFAFWHSSQRNDPGLNIALYANIKMDKLLEETRTISDESERGEKYKEFQKEIAKDAPAVFLYSPKFIYLMPSEIKGTEKMESVTVPSERFSQIHKWYIKTDKVWKIFAKQEN